MTPLMPACTASCCSSPRFSTRPPHSRNSASGRIRRKIAIHLTASHGSMNSRSPNFVPGRGLSMLIGTLVGSIAASSKAISTRCSRLSPRLRMPPTQVSSPASRTAVDRAQPALVADCAGDLVVVAVRRSRRCGARAGCPPRATPCARSAEMCPTEAQRLRLVCSDTSRTPSQVLLEVALGQTLALRDHAEAVCPRGLGRARVLEHLLGLHHRVHRRLGVGEARLRAEAAVLRAAAGLRVDQRAHVGGVGEALDARLPRPLRSAPRSAA